MLPVANLMGNGSNKMEILKTDIQKLELPNTLGITLDTWQQEVLDTEGNLVLRSGRQVGKSTIIALKAAIYAIENSNKTIMIIAKVERQAYLLLAKILINLKRLKRSCIKPGKSNVTKHIINLKNGSTIHCLPAGETGYGIMGFTIHLLIADEAAFIPEEVWLSIIPALAVSRGNIWLLSTPFIKKGYYYDCFSDPSFTAFHTSSEDCPRKDQGFLDHKKKTLTEAQYAQMYKGEFRDELRKFLPVDLIAQVCTLKPEIKLENNDYFLGVDIGGMGGDPSTFENLDGTDKLNIRQVAHELTTYTRTTDTTEKIIRLDRQWDYNQVGIDSGGMGVGVFDQLSLEEQTRRKVKALNNASKDIGNDKTKALLKEDMYNNLKCLMERQEIKLLDDPDVKDSLDNLQFEFTKRGTMKIFGKNSHIAEGLIRAAWLIKSKILNTYVM